ncbi:MAG: DUF1127 domain-containing protein [Rhodobacteraceae bacterium]|nr:MAG: DUF1127 domain-containing protein [Paracoccaceae bacterium]
MAVYEQSHAQIAIAGFADRIGRVILAMLGGLADWNAARRTRKILNRLSDAELDDIGLTRAQIDRVAGFADR